MHDEYRECRRCGRELPVTEFYPKYGAAKTGYVPDCKRCYIANVRLWQAANPEAVKATQKRYRASVQARRRAA